jgi:hypothetical protein
MRQLAGFLFVAACVLGLWLSGFYNHPGTPSAPSPVTSTQPQPRPSHKPGSLHVPHLRGLRWVRPARLFGGNWGGNGGNGQ